jgi:hypothetical protein
MTTLVDLEVAIDRKPRDPLRPAAELPHAGTMAFLPDGNLLVLHRPGGSSGVVVREHAPTADGTWSESRTAPLKGVRGSPLGCAVSADGARLAAGHKKARLYDWPGAAPGATLPGVRYQLERNSLGFSPSGARVVVADGGYVAPRNRTVTVCDTSTGAKLASIKTDEWSFAWAAMPDESTVLTVGLALDWVSGDEKTDGQRVLGCYDADTGRARWRRELRADQIPGLDLAAGRLWVAGDEAPYATKHLLALSIADGAVLRTIGLGERWRPGAAAPVAVAPSTLALAVSSSKYNAHRYVAVDVERGVVVAELGHGGDAVGAEFPAAAHAGTRRVAAEVDGTTVVWQLP